VRVRVSLFVHAHVRVSAHVKAGAKELLTCRRRTRRFQSGPSPSVGHPGPLRYVSGTNPSHLCNVGIALCNVAIMLYGTVTLLCGASTVLRAFFTLLCGMSTAFFDAII
jgi:hypothetical protein